MKPMTKAEYRRAIDALGLSQVEAGEFFELVDRTSRRYAGGGPIPAAVTMLLRLMVTKRFKPAQVKALGPLRACYAAVAERSATVAARPRGRLPRRS